MVFYSDSYQKQINVNKRNKTNLPLDCFSMKILTSKQLLTGSSYKIMVNARYPTLDDYLFAGWWGGPCWYREEF